MLSRIAESLFWIGRYVERADGTARLLDVHLQLLLEDPWVDEDTACRSLLEVIGSDAHYPHQLTRQELLTILSVDRGEPSSISASLNAARENARRVREIVSTELWECLNTTRSRMPRKVSIERAHDFFGWVRERTALAVGIVESSTSRDEAWTFFTLGRALERVDMTARLLATSELTEASGPSWTTILRSCGAYEAYLRTYRGVPSATNAAEFLLLDKIFPRSVTFALSRAETCLSDLQPTTARVGVTDNALRQVGQLRTNLEYRSAPEILANLTSEMIALQTGVSEISESIRSRYFPVNVMPTWVGEVS
ncbi:alpha-E domain-containing protein [Rhodoluna sp.]|uniref:alpha-E domain-containing protein n=1 Tax=Rhodoluna sp. TaxID=1969481 RepID=UPI0025EEAFA0|nr:alpha-E domain-containing protein [Rhodoluna sp.]